ncbi:MAG: hypothetical protein ACI9MX_003902 [Candidatus Aldehydirespiratoraceae bacterium]|jgi:hypothetical protein
MSSETRIVGMATALHALAGIVVATWVTGPLLAIDDLAFLSMGSTLAGDGAAPLAAQPPYGFLYPVLLVPGWFVGLGESQMVVYGQVLNALLGAALVPVLVVLLKRLTGAALEWRVVAALIGASLPAAMLTSNIVWTETLLALLVAVAALAVLRLWDEPTVGRGAVSLAVALALYATHPRMIVIAGLVVCAVGAIFIVRGKAAVSAAHLVAGIAGLRVVEWIRAAIADATFGQASTYDAGDLASRRGLSELDQMVVHGGGTLAYLMLATGGFAALGLAFLVRRRLAVGLAALAVVGSIVAVAGWFLTGVGRSDAYLHGRYIEVAAPLLVALGVIAAKELPWRPVVAVISTSVVLSGFYGAWAGPGNNWQRPRSPVMMLGTEVSGAPFGGNFFEPGAAASMALLVGLMVVVAARIRPEAPLLVMAATLAVAIPSGIAALDSLQENSVVGAVQLALAGEEIDLIVLDTELVSSNLTAAVAWEVGFDHATEALEIGTTHLLLPAEAASPPGARLVAELPGGKIWALSESAN